jgi:hypothetical protein
VCEIFTAQVFQTKEPEGKINYRSGPLDPGMLDRALRLMKWIA